MTARVVDTNVAIVANGGAAHADPGCVQAALRTLLDLQQDGPVVIDDAYRILGEYRRHLQPVGQPGPGDAYFQWLLRNQANPKCCEQAPITLRGSEGEDYLEFPEDPELAGFDRSDRKFVAVARVSAHRPVILNATDTRSWPAFRLPLQRHGVFIECLCPHLTQQTPARSAGNRPPPDEDHVRRRSSRRGRR